MADKAWYAKRTEQGICMLCKKALVPGLRYCKRHAKALRVTGKNLKIKKAMSELTLSDWECMSASEIARMVGCSFSTASSYRKRFMSKL